MPFGHLTRPLCALARGASTTLASPPFLPEREDAGWIASGRRVTATDPLEAALADLSLTYSGHISVHLPPFFSPAQRAHIVQAAGIQSFIGPCDKGMAAEHLLRPKDCPPLHRPLDPAVPGARRIIFTSGSSGTPKGVLIGETPVGGSDWRA